MTTTLDNRKVMVVDADPSMRMRFKQMLIGNGFDVAEAANGVEAISVYRDCLPDMVFMDIALPDMDGLAALNELKSIDSDAKVAMFIVIGQQALVVDALKAGAVDFVIKPIVQNQVPATISSASS